MSIRCSPSFILHPSSFRSGITLLEVLISIGILSVGVLSIASLIPLANYYQAETARYDRAAALGRQAIHDLAIKGYASPKRWLFVDPASPNPGSPVGILGLTSYNPLSAICVDPLGMSYAMAQSTAVNPFPCYFPAFPNSLPNPPGTAGNVTAPTIYRVGLTANDWWPAAAGLPATKPIPMSYMVAESFFRGTDDLTFDDPSDADKRPQAPNGAFYPDYAGEYSWFATLSHSASDLSSAANMRRFQASVVVTRGRDPMLWAASQTAGGNGLDPNKPPPERLVYAGLLQNGGQSAGQVAGLSIVNQPFYGGGGLNLYVYEPNNWSQSGNSSAATPNRHWLERVKPNTYLMLSASFFDNAKIANAPYARLAWYRIVTVDDGPTQDASNPQLWTRMVTVTGEDWPSMQYIDQISNQNVPLWQSADPNNPGLPITFCTIVDDAVAVYQDTVSLNNALIRN